jgi:glutamyl-tRNA synthetase/glutamyl-Q tRNA(Asp) synthetase
VRPPETAFRRYKSGGGSQIWHSPAFADKKTMRTRFAPAPTGKLHLGHVLNADYVWGEARRAAGEVLLRIEDHDRDRSRPVFEAGILDDLDWLGFRPDIFPTSVFRAGPCEGRQSDRNRHYVQAAEILRLQGRLFACDCTRKVLAAGRRTASGERIYQGRCRDRHLPLESGVGWRVRVDPGVERFVDLRLGPQEQEPASQCGDILIRDSRGHWTYQFAVTVDDWLQDIDLVVRGVDLLESTGRQILLARLLGRAEPPRFFHHPLIMKTPDQKLSKSDRDTAVSDLRAAGWSRRRILDTARAWAASPPLAPY